jgi:hypothetical protein
MPEDKQYFVDQFAADPLVVDVEQIRDEAETSRRDSRARCKKFFLHPAVVSDVWLMACKYRRLPKDLGALALAPGTFCTDLITQRPIKGTQVWPSSTPIIRIFNYCTG